MLIIAKKEITCKAIACIAIFETMINICLWIAKLNQALNSLLIDVIFIITFEVLDVIA